MKSIESSIQESLGTKPYCTKKQLTSLYLDLGLCGSPSGNNYMNIEVIKGKTIKSIKYSIEVYQDHAIIKGRLTSDVLTLLVRLCKKEGFTHLTNIGNEQGLKLVRKDDN